MTEPKIVGTYTERDKILDRQLQSYVFDEREVLRRVGFPQFVTRGGDFAVGLIVPQELTGKTGESKQEMKPIVLTSSRTFHPIFDGENRALGVRFDSIPAELPQRFSLLTVPRFLHKMDPVPEFRSIFERIREAYRETLYFREPWYAVHAVWDIATHFYTLFPAFPYLELRGVKGAAKTKVMRQSSCFSFNASPILSSPSEASLFRMVNDQRPTLYLDEAENLFRVVKGRVEHDGRVEVINSGYTSDGCVPRVEGERTRRVVVYRTYSPKMLASINGLHGATESRAILHVMTRAPDSDERGEREVEIHDTRFQKVRDELFSLMLGRWREVRKAYDAANIGGLKKRELQLWRPLLAVASLIGADVEAELLEVAKHQQSLTRVEDIAEGSWEYLLLERAHKLVKEGQRILYLKDLVAAIPEDQRPHNNKSISRLLDGLGFRDFKRTQDPMTRRIGYVIPSREDFEHILSTLNPSFFSFVSFDSSEQRGESEKEIDIETKETRRKEAFFEGKTSKESEEKKDSKEDTGKRTPSSFFRKGLRNDPKLLEVLSRPPRYDIALNYPNECERVVARIEREGPLTWPALTLLGFNEENLRRMIREGVIMENPAGMYRLVEG